jgi:hypothetical protein
MARPTVIIVTLAVLATLGGLAYVHARRDEVQNTAIPAATVAPRLQVEAPAVSPPEVAPAQPSTTPQITTGDVARWVADTQSNDAKSRAVAIEALANAPTAQAIPALKRVLESGEPQVDRQIALRSLHVLALNEGDNNGAIRETIRHAMYHSEDEAVTQSAQAFLEDIEAALAERAELAPN